jgi:hypothetical protein
MVVENVELYVVPPRSHRVQQGLCMGNLKGFWCLAFFALPVLAEVPKESCLRADQVGSPPTRQVTDAPVDVRITNTLEQLRRTMAVAPSVTIVDSSAGGVASARPPCRRSTPSYVITADMELLQKTENTYKGASEVLIAHELGHVLQYSGNPSLVESVCTNTLNEVKTLELLADFAAGYAVYSTEKLSIDRGNNLLVRTIASLADYGFADVTHHGTVTERMNAFDFGEAAALHGRSLDMQALMRNSAKFMDRLAGPRGTEVTTGDSYQRWVQESLQEIYQ